MSTIGDRIDRAFDLLKLLDAAMMGVQASERGLPPFNNMKDMAGAVRLLTAELYDEIAWISCVGNARRLPAPTDDEREAEARRRKQRKGLTSWSA